MELVELSVYCTGQMCPDDFNRSFCLPLVLRSSDGILAKTSAGVGRIPQGVKEEQFLKDKWEIVK